MVDDVLTSSERGAINQNNAQAVFKKFQSIRSKEKILEECGMRRKSKVSLNYNSGGGDTAEKIDPNYDTYDREGLAIEKNVAMLKNVLLHS
jgi:hypothetical protein